MAGTSEATNDGTRRGDDENTQDASREHSTMASISTATATSFALTSTSSALVNKDVQSPEEEVEAKVTMEEQNATTDESPAVMSETVDGTTPIEAPFDAELNSLGPVARAFLISQGITEVDVCMCLTAINMAPALAKFVEHVEQKKTTSSTAAAWISRWRRDLLQRRETLKEGIQYLHPTFEVFNQTVRSFFASRSVTKPKDLLEHQGLFRVRVAWRQETNLSAVNPDAARGTTSCWRKSITEQLDDLVSSVPTDTALQDTTTAALVNPEPLERPVKKRQRRTKVANTTYPWLSLNANGREITNTTIDGSNTLDAGTEEYASNVSGPQKKRARLETASLAATMLRRISLPPAPPENLAESEPPYHPMY